MRREKPVISTTEPAEQPSAEAMATVSYHKGNNKSPLLSVSFRWHSSFTANSYFEVLGRKPHAKN